MKLILALIITLASSKLSRPLEQAPPREAARANPYQQEERARKAGEKLFRQECAACHGLSAEGTRIAPALVGSPAMRKASPGSIEWVLRNGSSSRGMPSFAHLPVQRRWQIVTYLKSEN